MSYKGLPGKLVGQVSSIDARGYALASGWQRLPGVNGRVAVYTHPSSDLDQLIIPLDPATSDYPERMAEVVFNLAEKEKRSASEILDDLLLPPSDVLRFRIDDPGSRSGTLPLDQGIDLLMGARKALLSAACSVIQPQQFHPRLSRTEAEQLIRSSHLGQTERSSFTAIISCPIAAQAASRPLAPMFPSFEEQDVNASRASDASNSDHSHFTRRVTSLLMRSAARITLALDADDPDSLLQSREEDVPLSANFCEALLAMQPDGKHSRLCLSATWSRSLPLPKAGGIPSTVQLRREYFPAIESLASSLRPVREPQVAHFVGLVDSLSGDLDPDGLVRGEVQLAILNQDETIKARVVLSPEDYHTAWEMHGVGGYVSLNGVLTRSGRVYRIVGVRDFRSLGNQAH